MLPWDLQVYERALLERVICREAFTGFSGRPLTGHIIVLQINMSWPERQATSQHVTEVPVRKCPLQEMELNKPTEKEECLAGQLLVCCEL